MKRISTLIAASLLATSAWAGDAEPAKAEAIASLTAQEGTVLVNQGEEFVTAADAQSLMAGDRVMVMEGATAEITFADGCVLALESGSLLAVPAVSSCADAKMAKVERIGPTYAQAVGATSGEKDRTAEYIIFGGAGALILAALVNDDYSIRPDPPVPPISP